MTDSYQRNSQEFSSVSTSDEKRRTTLTMYRISDENEKSAIHVREDQQKQAIADQVQQGPPNWVMVTALIAFAILIVIMFLAMGGGLG